MENVYFALTREFNREGTIAVLTSGQAVVFYRTAIMSKDGDWVLDETSEACARILSILAARGARYRPCAPLDVRWLSGGWSSHFEFSDERRRRVRCDFLSRPPRLESREVRALFGAPREPGSLAVIDIESLIRMKRTQRAKDYPVIGELARRLPGEREILYTTDPDRILVLAPSLGAGVPRPPVLEALRGGTREDVVVSLARETNALQEEDRKRLERYERESRTYLQALNRSGILDRPLEEAHREILDIAGRLLPVRLPDEPRGDAIP